MDDDYSMAVKEAFVSLHDKGLIYRGERIINWCPRCQTALSDEEAEHKEKNGKLYHIKYPFKDDPQRFVIVATTRPETMLGDTAVAVNPKDGRYIKLIGKTLILPLVNREIKIIADDFVAADFGTGAVKVTPAHDPNDFMMGQRHRLTIINVMNPDASINAEGGKYKGLDRFEARKQILGDLESSGLLEKIEDHKNAVGHCYRCDTVVEPYLSKQWFVEMKPLAEPALKAVQKGDIKIYPLHWSKVYTNWMENIQDWCISRQIWWGHRIPVWYDKEWNYYVAKSEPEAQAQAQKMHGKIVELRQDEDVLDTWFSSWLWPFATLGWPEKNEDLKYFYPTDALMTASEILFFWVASMVMAGYEFMGNKPFSEVLIHGTVRDAKGRKMSKSLGNAIDPLEIIGEYGADALRFSLIINSGQDIFISKEKFEIGRNFANKIWNASRLVFMNCQDTLAKGDHENLGLKELDLPSRWILARFYETLSSVEAAIEEFRYSEAEILVQDFFWGNYCDWYLELIKAKFSDLNVQRTALFILKNSLKMMHPFIPFVTEEIYSKMNPAETCLSLAAWPKKQDSLVDAQAQARMQTIIDVITSVRAIRTKWGLKPNQQIIPEIIPDNGCEDLFFDNVTYIKQLARVDVINLNPKKVTTKDAAIVLVGKTKVIIPLKGIIDLEAEKKRKDQEIGQKQKAKEALESRLNNEVFVSKAPEEVIAKEKERLNSFNLEIAELKKDLAGLS